MTQVYGEAGSGKSQLAMFYALGVSFYWLRPSQGTFLVVFYLLKNNWAGTDLQVLLIHSWIRLNFKNIRKILSTKRQVIFFKDTCLLKKVWKRLNKKEKEDCWS